MRCYVCDYSYDAPSEFHSGLVAKRPNRRFKTDHRRNVIVCSVCSDEAGDALREMEEESEFNEPMFDRIKH